MLDLAKIKVLSDCIYELRKMRSIMAKNGLTEIAEEMDKVVEKMVEKLHEITGVRK